MSSGLDVTHGNEIPSYRDYIVTVRGNGLKLYYLESLKIAKPTSSQEREEREGDAKKDSKGKQKFIRRDSTVMMTNLDPRGELEGDSVKI
jgi:hypothetical protein